ncbi:hypothetical protein Cgig2_002325 [Carnegiea gigantea]|uniref:Water stress and hypersensitive response domain-containing protein n=1 Tax=Carnegiea gigantea TaxID=171969 RepID=A0A9Q1JYW2_9CARY|nr:hypothetical protein Cgig2_002325 [Carnegiea gigantea]
MELIEKAKEYVSEKVQEKIENIPKPEATLHGLSLEGVGWNGISYKATVGIMNPYPHSIPLCDVAYVLKSDGRVILSGNMPDPGDIAGKHETTKLDVEIKVPHSAVVSLVRDVWKDWDIDYVLEVTLTIDIPIIGSFNIPLSTSGEIKLPTISDFWSGGEEDGKRDKDEDKDKDDDGDDEDMRKERKRDEDEKDQGGISSIPIIGSLLGRGGSDDEKEKENDEGKSDDDDEHKAKRKDKKKGSGEDEEEKGRVNIPIISDLLGGGGSDDEKDKDKDSDDGYKDKKNKKKKKKKEEDDCDD